MDKGTKLVGVECPNCGSIYTSGRHGGYSPSGHRIRRRVCKECDLHFNTVEVSADFVFNRVDTAAQERARKQRLKRPRKYRVTVLRTNRIYNDDLVVMVKVKPGKENPWCYKLKHRMVGDNVHTTARGHRRCWACLRQSRKERSAIERLVNGDTIRRRQREWYARQGQALRDKRAAQARERKLLQRAVA